MLDTEENPSKVNQTASHIDRYESPSYRRYVLFMLTIVYAFNFIDRQLLVILQESIKQDMGLSDTQLGLLTGLAFVIFYVTAAIPIARLADRSNRRNIISWAIGIWSFMTAIGGLSLNYFHLLLARIGVGLGEAGCSPPAHSMISDMYPAENRATVISIYSIGVNAGILLGFFFGGILNEFFGWRVAFVVVGLPGIALALWFRLTVAEPIRGKFEKKPIAKEAIPFVEVFKTLFGNKVILHLMLGSSLCAFVGYVGAQHGLHHFLFARMVWGQLSLVYGWLLLPAYLAASVLFVPVIFVTNWVSKISVGICGCLLFVFCLFCRALFLCC